MEIFERDPTTDYSVARHILDELAAQHGLSAIELGDWLGDDSPTGHRIGAWLRDMHARGWVRPERVSPGSTRVRWHLTEEGCRELERARKDREASEANDRPDDREERSR